ncbi:MAG: hypothetical protein RLY14_484 [Planctomycetota bacterium]|jgi:diaminohydroxyphosphoribosylaminopyrimidine deaminase/5-amino-6-(5-phosphoribosylamino)uracil reductase
MLPSNNHLSFMMRAMELAFLGRGYVEPNPLVGCVIVKDNRIVGEGYHRRFGESHAEVEAIKAAQGVELAGSTFYVTLEPCSHFGKTPPCVDAIVRAKPARVVVGMQDPFAAVQGKGIQSLRSQGIDVVVGVGETEAKKLNAPYLTLIGKRRPHVLGKWAMTADGKIATATGSSQWISCTESRQCVQQLRGRVDAIIVGSGTAIHDDPLLTARSGGPRKPLRVLFDGQLQLKASSQLAQTAKQFPTMIWTGPKANATAIEALRKLECEVIQSPSDDSAERLSELLKELGRRRCTNLLCEGGAGLLGALFDQRWLDEVHLFVAPKIIGGAQAKGPVGGLGLSDVNAAAHILFEKPILTGDDIYLRGLVQYKEA